MSTIIKGLLNQNLPWGLVLVGIFICGHARAVRHPLALVRRRLLPADRDDGADLRGRTGALVGRAADRASRGIRGRRGTLFSSGLIAGGSICRHSVRDPRRHRHDRAVPGDRQRAPVSPWRRPRRPDRWRTALLRAGDHCRPGGPQTHRLDPCPSASRVEVGRQPGAPGLGSHNGGNDLALGRTGPRSVRGPQGHHRQGAARVPCFLSCAARGRPGRSARSGGRRHPQP